MTKDNVISIQTDNLENGTPTPSVSAKAKEAAISPQHKGVLELSHTEARAFFLKGKSYINIDLPPYYKFDALLADVSQNLAGKNLSEFREKKPSDYDDLNYKILNNKDGRYAWRPMQLIHPALYVSLVHKITEDDNWTTIKSRFDQLHKNPKIECMSLPVLSLSDNSDKAEQISHWWHDVEQKSITLSLDYSHLIHADLADCYSSIYTHSVVWALHGKEIAKTKRKDNLIGNIIDWHLQDMAHGQTNGIPQGSVLMDFIAEIVLGYADHLLSEKISGEITDYHIIRYRDDYRVFTNSSQDGEKIIKYITEVMIGLGLKLNPTKTKASSQIVSASIKDDKLYWIGQKQSDKSIQKHLLMIHNLATLFPNSGSLNVSLDKFHKRIKGLTNIQGDIVPLISIIVDIAYNNPKTYALSSAILSKFISLLDDDSQRHVIIEKIKKCFNKIPNTGYLMIWLQRITLTFDKDHAYDGEPMCHLVRDKTTAIWNSEWLKPSLAKIIDPAKIIDNQEIEKLPDVIQPEEVELFLSSYDG